MSLWMQGKTGLRWWALAGCMAMPWLAQAQNETPPRPTPQVVAPAAGHHDPLQAQIHQTRLRRLYERTAKAPQTLREQCRFESDITTPPPAGVVALTFDDGPEPGQTEQLLRVLAHYDVPATFFLIGEKMQKHPELVQDDLSSQKHLIASHSWDHPNFHELGEAAQKDEIERGLAQMPESLSPRLYRYPYGNSSCAGNELLHAQGYQIVGWHVDSCDWAFDRNGSVALHEAVSCGVAVKNRSDYVGHVVSAIRERKGGIVLMHEIHPNTLARLSEIIEALQKEGYRFARLDDPALADSLR